MQDGLLKTEWCLEANIIKVIIPFFSKMWYSSDFRIGSVESD